MSSSPTELVELLRQEPRDESTTWEELRRLPKALNSMGGVQVSLGKIKESEDYFLEALALVRKSVDLNPKVFEDDMCISLYNLAGVYTMLKRPEAAYNCEKEVRELKKKRGLSF